MGARKIHVHSRWIKPERIHLLKFAFGFGKLLFNNWTRAYFFFKLSHGESINVLKQFTFRDIMLGFEIQKIGFSSWIILWSMYSVYTRKIKAVWQLIETSLVLKDVGNYIKAWKVLGNFAVSSLNTIVKTSVFQFFLPLSSEAWPFNSCPFKYFCLL